jgi:hypothetical protein
LQAYAGSGFQVYRWIESHEEGRTSFLKKRSKKLLDSWSRGGATGVSKGIKVFWFFFSKKNILP